MEDQAVSKFEPTSDRVLVQMQSLKEKTDAGLYIPQSAQDRVSARYGKVIAVGPGRYIDGVLVTVQLKVGDEVYCDRVGGLELDVEGTKYVIFRYDEILGRFV
jgi:chaperonin GroES